MRQKKVPIYCGRCGKLALANLNDAPLCPHCLISAVRQSSDPSLLGQISPLSIATATISNLVKCSADPYNKKRIVKNAAHDNCTYKY